ncbi:unnamed protein product [Ectocarpus sp. CCAP 1310/34]|nr:unnamed protein product [Ectocarpus sp. CCAP 1310/34]
MCSEYTLDLIVLSKYVLAAKRELKHQDPKSAPTDLECLQCILQEKLHGSTVADSTSDEVSWFNETDRLLPGIVSSEPGTGDGHGQMVVMRVYEKEEQRSMQHCLHQAMKKLEIHDGSADMRPLFSVVSDNGWKRQAGHDRRGSRRTASLSYADLLNVPMILILCDKGRTGDTFPHSLDCFDLRIRTAEQSFSTFEQELGRLCRYQTFMPIDGGETTECSHAFRRKRVLKAHPNVRVEESAFRLPTMLITTRVMGIVHNAVNEHRKTNTPISKDKTGTRNERRLVLSAECQVGKTGAYLHYLKILKRAASPIATPPPPFPIFASSGDVVSWLLPHWRMLSNTRPLSEMYGSLFAGKYTAGVANSRAYLVVQSCKRDRWVTNFQEFLRNVLAHKVQGETIKNEAGRRRIAGLEPRLEAPFDAEARAIGTEASYASLKAAIDWVGRFHTNHGVQLCEMTLWRSSLRRPGTKGMAARKSKHPFQYRADSALQGLAVSTPHSLKGGIKELLRSKETTRWVFTPSFNRFLPGPRQALLDRSEALPKPLGGLDVGPRQEHDRDVMVWVNRAHNRCSRSMFKSSWTHFGDHYVTMELPMSMPSDESPSSRCSPKEGGIGYTRHFIRRWSQANELPFAWMLDDNVQLCHELDVGKEQAKCQPCSFTQVMNSLERLKLAEDKNGIRVSTASDKEGSTRDVLEYVKVDGVRGEACPRESDLLGGDTPKQPRAVGQKITTVGDLCGHPGHFGVLGIARHGYGCTNNKEVRESFGVTHSVYSFYLLNVASTVSKGAAPNETPLGGHRIQPHHRRERPGGMQDPKVLSFEEKPPTHPAPPASPATDITSGTSAAACLLSGVPARRYRFG